MTNSELNRIAGDVAGVKYCLRGGVCLVYVEHDHSSYRWEPADICGVDQAVELMKKFSLTVSYSENLRLWIATDAFGTVQVDDSVSLGRCVCKLLVELKNRNLIENQWNGE